MFYFSELRRMIYAENIHNAYRSREQSDNWVAWATQNPVLDQILSEAEILYAEETGDA